MEVCTLPVVMQIVCEGNAIAVPVVSPSACAGARNLLQQLRKTYCHPQRLGLQVLCHPRLRRTQLRPRLIPGRPKTPVKTMLFTTEVAPQRRRIWGRLGRYANRGPRQAFDFIVEKSDTLGFL